jgi:mannose-6-phosphate isomerase-like protein (cupin superfamily)
MPGNASGGLRITPETALTGCLMCSGGSLSARAASHSHRLDQTLHLTEGIGIVATRGMVVILWPGDAVRPPPGEEHAAATA